MKKPIKTWALGVQSKYQEMNSRNYKNNCLIVVTLNCECNKNALTIVLKKHSRQLKKKSNKYFVFYFRSTILIYPNTSKIGKWNKILQLNNWLSLLLSYLPDIILPCKFSVLSRIKNEANPWFYTVHNWKI